MKQNDAYKFLIHYLFEFFLRFYSLIFLISPGVGFRLCVLLDMNVLIGVCLFFC